MSFINLHTLPRFLAKGLMKDICDGLEDVCLDFLLGVGVKEEDLHGPVAQRKASNTAVGARTVDGQPEVAKTGKGNVQCVVGVVTHEKHSNMKLTGE